MGNISIILSDLDGTLFRNDKSISDFTKEIIRQAQAKGLLFGICTSRAKVNAIQFLEGIKPDIFITNGGGMVYYKEQKISCNKKQLFRCYNIDTQKGELLMKNIWKHLLLTFYIMGICWGLCLVLGFTGITMKEYKWIYLPWMLGGISPAIASFIVLKKNGEVAGFKDWLGHVFDFKQSPWSYLLAITLPLFHMILMCLISGYRKGLPLYFLPLMILAMIFGGGLEEAGWRYITWPELNKKFGFVLSTLITAVIWWIWHLPLFFIQGVSQYHKSFLVFGIMVLGLSFMLAVIRKLTGSVWLCVLCHAIVNSMSNFYHYDFYGSYLASSITAAVLIVISLLLIFIFKRRRP